jgi:autotransporter translocation and assembly factor TamB
MRRRLRWWSVTCLAVGLILAGLAVVSWLTFRAYGPALARERLEEALTRAVQHPVRIERVILRPWLGRLQILNVRVESVSPEDAEPIVRLGQVHFQFGISSLWKRELVLSKILLQDLTLRLVGPRGDSPPPTLDLPDRLEIGPIVLHIQTVQIQRGRVTYHDRRRDFTLHIQDLEATAHPQRRGIDATLRLGSLRLEWPGLSETVTDIEAAGWLHDRLASLRRVTGKWHEQEIRVSGEVRHPFAAPEAHLAIRGSLDLAQLPRAARTPEPIAGLAKGEMTLDGRWEDMRISGQIAVPNLTVGRLMARDVRVSGDVRHAFAAPDLDLAVRGSLDLARLPHLSGVPEPVTGAARGEGKLRGQPEALKISGNVIVPELTVGPIRAQDVAVRGQWSESLLDLAEVSARIFDGNLRGSLVTRFDRPGDTRASLTLQQASLAALDGLARTPLGLRGELDVDAQVEGDLRRLDGARGRIRLMGKRVTLPGDLNRIGAGTLDVEGTLRNAAVELTRATGDWTGIRIEATGTLGAQGPEGLRVALGTDLGFVAPLWGRRGLTGQATLRGEANGRWGDPEFIGQLRVPLLTVTGTRIDGLDVPVRFRGRTLHLDSAAGTLGQSRVTLSGDLAWRGDGDFSAESLSRSLRFRADVHAPAARWEDLAHWLPPAWQGSGRFGLSGRLEGNPATWRASGSLEAPSLTTRSGIPIQDLRSTFTLDQKQFDIADLRAQVSGLSVRGTGGWTWDGSGQATAELGPMDLSRIPNLPAHVALRGTGRARVEVSIRPGGVEGSGVARLGDVSVEEMPLGDGTIRVALANGLLRGDLAFPDAKLTGTATGRLEGNGPLSVRLVAREVALGPIARRISQQNGTQLDGAVTAVAEFTVPLSAPSALRGTVTLDPVRLVVAGEDWLNRGPVVIHWGAAGLDVDRLNLASRLGNLTAGGRLDPRGILDFEVRGQIPLAILPALRPEIRDAGGLLTLTARVGGTAAAPSIRGDAVIREGRLQFRNYPETLRQIEARCILSPEGLRLVEAEASLGRGRIRASGDLSFEGGKPGFYRARISAQNISVAPVEGLQTVWDLDLEFVGRGAQPRLRGEGRLVRGRYAGDLSLLSILLRETPGKAASAGPAIPLRLLLRLDNNLQIQTNVAHLRVDGTVSLEGTAAEPILFGRVESREGQITFRRQRWTVTSAAARFNDPRRFDPIVDLTATTRIRSYDVTMQVSGRSEELTVQLSSKPPLAQEEILSLVTMGVPRPPSGQSGAGLMLGEVAKLFVEDLVGIGTSSLGLDMLDLRTVEDAGQTKMQVGAQVTEQVQVIYSQTLRGSSKRLLRIEYQVLGPLLIAGEQNFEGGYGGDVFIRLRFR